MSGAGKLHSALAGVTSKMYLVKLDLDSLKEGRSLLLRQDCTRAGVGGAEGRSMGLQGQNETAGLSSPGLVLGCSGKRKKGDDAKKDQNARET